MSWRGQERDGRMGLEQIFALIASLAVLVWLAPSVFRMPPAAREMTAKLALGLVVLGIVIAIGAFVAG